MADKTILLLMIAFVLSGILAYDRYKMDHGERGPVAELLDFAGLAQYDEAPQQRTTVIQDVYEYNPRAVLRQMRELHQKYEEERKKFVDNRKEVIERIIELNDEVASTAAIYTDELTQESARFLEKFPQVETLIGRIHQIPSQDKTLHSQNIQDIHGQIVNVFKQFIDDPTKNKLFKHINNLPMNILNILTMKCFILGWYLVNTANQSLNLRKFFKESGTLLG